MRWFRDQGTGITPEATMILTLIAALVWGLTRLLG